MSDGAPMCKAQHARHGAQLGATLSSFLWVRPVTIPLYRWEDWGSWPFSPVSRRARPKASSECFQCYALHEPGTSQAILGQLKSGLQALSWLGITECGWGWRWAVPFWSLQEQEVCCPGHTHYARYALPTGVLFQERSEVSQYHSSLWPGWATPWPGGERLLWAEDASWLVGRHGWEQSLWL